MKFVAVIFELLLILGAIVATSGLIAAQKPDAAKLLAKLAPFQALIGIAMLIMGIVFFLVIGPVAVFKAIKVDALPGMVNLVGIIIAVVLGFMFAVPQLIGLAPGQERRAYEVAEKLAPWQLLIGLGAAACGVFGLLYTFGIMKYASTINL
jgi:hypothetical protein